jgi:hypothetical protein
MDRSQCVLRVKPPWAILVRPVTLPCTLREAAVTAKLHVPVVILNTR